MTDKPIAPPVDHEAEIAALKARVAELEKELEVARREGRSQDYAIQQARRAVLEMACKAACIYCRIGFKLTPLDAGHHVGSPIPGMQCGCGASKIRRDFAARWPETEGIVT